MVSWLGPPVAGSGPEHRLKVGTEQRHKLPSWVTPHIEVSTPQTRSPPELQQRAVCPGQGQPGGTAG